MKLQISHDLQKESLFVVILLGFFVYFTSLLVITQQLLLLFVEHVQLVNECLANVVHGGPPGMPTDLVVNSLLIVAIVILWTKLLWAVSQAGISFTRTKEHISYFHTDSDNHQVFTSGLWHQKTFWGSSLKTTLTEKEYRSVELHEKYHRDRKDPLKKLIVNLIFDAMLLPRLISQLRDNYHLLTELAADQAALDEGCSKRSVVGALTKLVSADVRLQLANYSDQLQRVEILIGKQRLGSAIIALQLIAFIFAVIAFPLSVNASGVTAVEISCKRINYQILLQSPNPKMSSSNHSY